MEGSFWMDWNISERGTSFQLQIAWVLDLSGYQIKGKEEEIGFDLFVCGSIWGVLA